MQCGSGIELDKAGTREMSESRLWQLQITEDMKIMVLSGFSDGLDERD